MCLFTCSNFIVHDVHKVHTVYEYKPSTNVPHLTFHNLQSKFCPVFISYFVSNLNDLLCISIEFLFFHTETH